MSLMITLMPRRCEPLAGPRPPGWPGPRRRSYSQAQACHDDSCLASITVISVTVTAAERRGQRLGTLIPGPGLRVTGPPGPGRAGGPGQTARKP